MRLTSFSDYALRLLLYAASHPDRLVTIEEAAGAYGISRSHLTKVANLLTRTGFLTAVRGRSGGLRIGRPATAITLGEVLRVTEPDFTSIDCLDTGEGESPAVTGQLGRPAALDTAMADALAAFLATMDARTLADLLPRSTAAERPAPGPAAREPARTPTAPTGKAARKEPVAP